MPGCSRHPEMGAHSPRPIAPHPRNEDPTMWLDANSALRHLPRLHAAAFAITGNRADAEDLVQETYLTLLRRPRRLRGGSELAYLMTMLRNRHIDECRTATRRQMSVGLYEVADQADPR